VLALHIHHLNKGNIGTKNIYDTKTWLFTYIFSSSCFQIQNIILHIIILSTTL